MGLSPKMALLFSLSLLSFMPLLSFGGENSNLACPIKPIPSFMDVVADPPSGPNSRVMVFVYNISETDYIKNGIPGGLVFLVNQSNKSNIQLFYQITNSEGWSQFTYDSNAEGCTDYWFIFCPLSDAVSSEEARQMCLNGTKLPSTVISSTPQYIPNSQPSICSQKTTRETCEDACAGVIVSPTPEQKNITLASNPGTLNSPLISAGLLPDLEEEPLTSAGFYASTRSDYWCGWQAWLYSVCTAFNNSPCSQQKDRTSCNNLPGCKWDYNRNGSLECQSWNYLCDGCMRAVSDPSYCSGVVDKYSCTDRTAPGCMWDNSRKKCVVSGICPGSLRPNGTPYNECPDTCGLDGFCSSSALALPQDLSAPCDSDCMSNTLCSLDAKRCTSNKGTRFVRKCRPGEYLCPNNQCKSDPQKCCPNGGTYCPDSGACRISCDTSFSAGTPPIISSCGEENQPCCNSGNQCNSNNLTCYSGTCQKCGAENQPCCSGNVCGPNLKCNTTSQKCYAPCLSGQTLCADGKCRSPICIWNASLGVCMDRFSAGYQTSLSADNSRYLPSINQFYVCNKKPSTYAGLCWPIMLIIGLLMGASFLSGRNPFSAFDMSAPRMGRGRQYTMRTQSKSFDITSAVTVAGNKALETGSGIVTGKAEKTLLTGTVSKFISKHTSKALRALGKFTWLDKKIEKATEAASKQGEGKDSSDRVKTVNLATGGEGQSQNKKVEEKSQGTGGESNQPPGTNKEQPPPGKQQPLRFDMSSQAMGTAPDVIGFIHTIRNLFSGNLFKNQPKLDDNESIGSVLLKNVSDIHARISTIIKYIFSPESSDKKQSQGQEQASTGQKVLDFMAGVGSFSTRAAIGLVEIYSMLYELNKSIRFYQTGFGTLFGKISSAAGSRGGIDFINNLENSPFLGTKMSIGEMFRLINLDPEITSRLDIFGVLSPSLNSIRNFKEASINLKEASINPTPIALRGEKIIDGNNVYYKINGAFYGADGKEITNQETISKLKEKEGSSVFLVMKDDGTLKETNKVAFLSALQQWKKSSESLRNVLVDRLNAEWSSDGQNLYFIRDLTGTLDLEKSKERLELWSNSDALISKIKENYRDVPYEKVLDSLIKFIDNMKYDSEEYRNLLLIRELTGTTDPEKAKERLEALFRDLNDPEKSKETLEKLSEAEAKFSKGTRDYRNIVAHYERLLNSLMDFTDELKERFPLQEGKEISAHELLNQRLSMLSSLQDMIGFFDVQIRFLNSSINLASKPLSEDNLKMLAQNQKAYFDYVNEFAKRNQIIGIARYFATTVSGSDQLINLDAVKNDYKKDLDKANEKYGTKYTSIDEALGDISRIKDSSISYFESLISFHDAALNYIRSAWEAGYDHRQLYYSMLNSTLQTPNKIDDATKILNSISRAHEIETEILGNRRLNLSEAERNAMQNIINNLYENAIEIINLNASKTAFENANESDKSKIAKEISDKLNDFYTAVEQFNATYSMAATAAQRNQYGLAKEFIDMAASKVPAGEDEKAYWYKVHFQNIDKLYRNTNYKGTPVDILVLDANLSSIKRFFESMDIDKASRMDGEQESWLKNAIAVVEDQERIAYRSSKAGVMDAFDKSFANLLESSGYMPPSTYLVDLTGDLLNEARGATRSHISSHFPTIFGISGFEQRELGYLPLTPIKQWQISIELPRKELPQIEQKETKPEQKETQPKLFAFYTPLWTTTPLETHAYVSKVLQIWEISDKSLKRQKEVTENVLEFLQRYGLIDKETAEKLRGALKEQGENLAIDLNCGVSEDVLKMFLLASQLSFTRTVGLTDEAFAQFVKQNSLEGLSTEAKAEFFVKNAHTLVDIMGAIKVIRYKGDKGVFLSEKNKEFLHNYIDGSFDLFNRALHPELYPQEDNKETKSQRKRRKSK